MYHEYIDDKNYNFKRSIIIWLLRGQTCSMHLYQDQMSIETNAIIWECWSNVMGHYWLLFYSNDNSVVLFHIDWITINRTSLKKINISIPG